MNFKYLHTIYYINLHAIARIQYVNLSSNVQRKDHLEKDDDEWKLIATTFSRR